MKFFIYSLIVLASLSFNTANASELILTNISGRDTGFDEELTLSEDGQSCVRERNLGTNNQKSITKTEKSLACRYVKAAKEIEAAIGTCNSQKDETTGNMISGLGHQEYFIPDDDTFKSLAIGPKDKIVGHSFIKQSCMCGKVIETHRDFHINPLKAIRIFYGGPYYKDTYKFYSITAAECANFFSTPAHQEAVIKIYSQNGLE